MKLKIISLLSISKANLSLKKYCEDPDTCEWLLSLDVDDTACLSETELFGLAVDESVD